MGTLYLHRVRELLKSRGGIHPFPAITFSNSDKTTKDELINRMCQAAGIPMNDIANEASDRLIQLIQRLLNAVDSGRTLLVEISCEEPDSGFLKWLIQDFWTKFRNELVQTGHDKGVLRVIILLIAHFEVECDDELMLHICRELNTFQSQKIFEISLLTHWEEKQIKQWLYAQLADELEYYGYPRLELEKLAQRVMQRANGMPRQVCNEFTGTTLDWLISRLAPTSVAS